MIGTRQLASLRGPAHIRCMEAVPVFVPRLRLALGFTAVVALATLGTAIASERWGGLVPCALCLVERWPWRIAAGLGIVGAVAPRHVSRLLAWLVVPVMLAGVIAGGVHVGVEWKLWPSPLPECEAPRFQTGSIAQRLASMPLKPSKSCEDATYLIPFVPVSMAMMNLLDALVVGAGMAWFLMTSRDGDA